MCNECEKENIKIFKKNTKPLTKTHPELCKEWNYEENDKLGIRPENITYGISVKVWWICFICHRNYDASLNNRTNKKNQCGCPYCSSKKVCLENCLATKFPEIAKEWDYENNKELIPFDFTYGSDKKVSWLCPDCKESYEAQINSRTNMKTGCPFCSGQKVCLWNCLATLKPDIAKQWHPTKNGTLTPFDFTCGSSKKVYWLCFHCNKDYNATINNKVSGNKGCPYCRGLKVCLENCLATLNPEVAKEWNQSKNGTLTPFDITIGSKKKVNWICSINSEHKWKTQICNRTNKKHGTGCPYCNIFYHEKLCREIMKDLFSKEFVKYRHKTLKNKGSLELDCYNEELKINIEYDGIQHYEFYLPFHKTEKDFIKQQENDCIKDQWCKNNNILNIRVSYLYDIKEEIENYITEQLIIHNRINDV